MGVRKIRVDYNDSRSPGWLEMVATRAGRIIYERTAPRKDAPPRQGKRQDGRKAGGERP